MHDLTALWLHPVADRRTDLARPRAGGKHDGIGGVGVRIRSGRPSRRRFAVAASRCPRPLSPLCSGQLDQAVAERAAVHPGHLRQSQAACRRCDQRVPGADVVGAQPLRLSDGCRAECAHELQRPVQLPVQLVGLSVVEGNGQRPDRSVGMAGQPDRLAVRRQLEVTAGGLESEPGRLQIGRAGADGGENSGAGCCGAAGCSVVDQVTVAPACQSRCAALAPTIPAPITATCGMTPLSHPGCCRVRRSYSRRCPASARFEGKGSRHGLPAGPP